MIRRLDEQMDMDPCFVRTNLFFDLMEKKVRNCVREELIWMSSVGLELFNFLFFVSPLLCELFFYFYFFIWVFLAVNFVECGLCKVVLLCYFFSSREYIDRHEDIYFFRQIEIYIWFSLELFGKIFWRNLLLTILLCFLLIINLLFFINTN